jgi:tRNA G26 N,N-dimethylase Trm1
VALQFDSMIIEGKSKILHCDTVFYSPHQSLHREVTVSIERYFFQLHFNNVEVRHLDLFCGCGIRSLRFLTEVCPIAKAVAVDNDESAIALATEHTKLNCIADQRLRLIRDNINIMDLASLGVGQFHVIEIDPYGSSLPYVSRCLPLLVDGGLLNITCTNIKGVIGDNGEHVSRCPSGIVAPHEFGVRFVLSDVCDIIVAGGGRPVPLACWALPHGCRLMIQVHSTPLNNPHTAHTRLSHLFCDGGGVAAVMTELHPGYEEDDTRQQQQRADTLATGRSQTQPPNRPSGDLGTCDSTSGKRKLGSLDSSYSFCQSMVVLTQSPALVFGGHIIDHDIVSQALSACESSMEESPDRYTDIMAVASLLRSLLQQDGVVTAAEVGQSEGQSEVLCSFTANEDMARLHWCVVDTQKLWRAITQSSSASFIGYRVKRRVPSVDRICTALAKSVAAPIPLSHGAIMVCFPHHLQYQIKHINCL